ncbi:hypothetical protein RJ639_010273 [Escallonia herrerae]|uniref:glutaredoxin-dependent peroxiredoxin n=1 Tax=Escallonia herrerae TaxID=1293975 RepID=A0AA88VVE1_9ASTE|nr:hypothetical protein RJ639_010273 [Escallonia herrerae]
MATTTASFTLSRLLSSAPKSLSPISTTIATFRLLLKLRCPYPKPLRFSTTNKISATMSVGDKLPESTFSYFNPAGELQTTTKAILFAVPGAFTPTCSHRHLPGFFEKSGELKSKGVDTIAYISFNDAFVMKAWKKDLGINDEPRHKVNNRQFRLLVMEAFLELILRIR